MNTARYARQMIVAEIGDAGQARLKAAAAPLAGVGLAHEIATALRLTDCRIAASGTDTLLRGFRT